MLLIRTERAGGGGVCVRVGASVVEKEDMQQNKLGSRVRRRR